MQLKDVGKLCAISDDCVKKISIQVLKLKHYLELATKLSNMSLPDFDISSTSKNMWTCLSCFCGLFLTTSGLRDVRACLRVFLIQLLNANSRSGSMQPVVKSFVCDTMSDLRKIISDQMTSEKKSHVDVRALLDLATDLQPFRRQINMPLFKKHLNIVSHAPGGSSLAPDDLEPISISNTSSSLQVRKPMWQASRTVSASRIKHRLAALNVSQSVLNSQIDNRIPSACRG